MHNDRGVDAPDSSIPTVTRSAWFREKLSWESLYTSNVGGDESRRAPGQHRGRTPYSTQQDKNAPLGIHIYNHSSKHKPRENGNIKKKLSDHLHRLSTPPQLLAKPHPFPSSTYITSRPRPVTSQGMKRPQNNSTTTQSIPIPLFPISKKAKERKRKQKKEACSPKQ